MEYFIPSPKKGSESKAKVISRRAFALTSFKFVFLAMVVSRLFYLQIIKRDEFIIKLGIPTNEAIIILSTLELKGLIVESLGVLSSRFRH